LEGSGRGLFDGIIPAFEWGNGGKSQKVSR